MSLVFDTKRLYSFIFSDKQIRVSTAVIPVHLVCYDRSTFLIIFSKKQSVAAR